MISFVTLCMTRAELGSGGDAFRHTNVVLVTDEMKLVQRRADGRLAELDCRPVRAEGKVSMFDGELRTFGAVTVLRRGRRLYAVDLAEDAFADVGSERIRVRKPAAAP